MRERREERSYARGRTAESTKGSDAKVKSRTRQRMEERRSGGRVGNTPGRGGGGGWLRMVVGRLRETLLPPLAPVVADEQIRVMGSRNIDLG